MNFKPKPDSKLWEHFGDLDEVHSFSSTAPRLAIISQSHRRCSDVPTSPTPFESPTSGLCKRLTYRLLAGEQAGLSAAGSVSAFVCTSFSTETNRKEGSEKGREKWRIMKQLYFGRRNSYLDLDAIVVARDRVVATTVVGYQKG